MAKDEKAKVRIFFSEIEGSNETVRDGLRSFANAISKSLQPQSALVRVIEVPQGVPDEKLIEMVQEEDQASDGPTNEDAESRAKDRRERKANSYSFVRELDLHPEGKESFRDFFSEKGPTNHQEAVTVAVYYLTMDLEIQGVTPDHVYTALKDVEAKIPKDILSAINNTSHRRNWIDSSNSNALKTTAQGNHFVEHDLPKRNLTGSKK